MSWEKIPHWHFPQSSGPPLIIILCCFLKILHLNVAFKTLWKIVFHSNPDVFTRLKLFIKLIDCYKYALAGTLQNQHGTCFRTGEENQNSFYLLVFILCTSLQNDFFGSYAIKTMVWARIWSLGDNLIPWLTVWGTFLFLGGQTNQFLLKIFVTIYRQANTMIFFTWFL